MNQVLFLPSTVLYTRTHAAQLIKKVCSCNCWNGVCYDTQHSAAAAEF